MSFGLFMREINRLSDDNNIKFNEASEIIKNYISGLPKEAIIEVVKEIGTIPECIESSSSKEKFVSSL